MQIKAPIIEDMISQWEKDCIIDQTEPGKELLRIPLLHSKYNKYLTLHNLSAKRIGIKINELRKLKWLYYSGKMDKEQLAELQWEPFQFILMYNKIMLKSQHDAIKKYGIKFDIETFYSEIAQDIVFLEELNKILNKCWSLSLSLL